MLPRAVTSRLLATAADLPAVPVLGARQVGKTMAARTAFPGHLHFDLEDPRTGERLRHDARFEPDAGGDRGLIVDEAQCTRRCGDTSRPV